MLGLTTPSPTKADRKAIVGLYRRLVGQGAQWPTLMMVDAIGFAMNGDWWPKRIRTLALVFHKLAALAAGLALILALIAWFWTDHSKSDFVPCFWGSIGVIVGSIIIRALAELVLERPIKAERRAAKRTAAQFSGGTTMYMPVSEEVATALDADRNERHDA